MNFDPNISTADLKNEITAALRIILQKYGGFEQGQEQESAAIMELAKANVLEKDDERDLLLYLYSRMWLNYIEATKAHDALLAEYESCRRDHAQVLGALKTALTVAEAQKVRLQALEGETGLSAEAAGCGAQPRYTIH